LLDRSQHLLCLHGYRHNHAMQRTEPLIAGVLLVVFLTVCGPFTRPLKQ